MFSCMWNTGEHDPDPKGEVSICLAVSTCHSPSEAENVTSFEFSGEFTIENVSSEALDWNRNH